MLKGYLFYTPGGIIFFETEKRRTDETAREAIEKLKTIYPDKIDLFERAKNDRATLDDTKRRLQPYTLTETKTRYIFKSRRGSVVDIPKETKGYTVFTK